jgi:hypothetical protein
VTGHIAGRTELTLADQYAAIYWAAPRAFRVCLIALVVLCPLIVVLELASAQANLTIIGAMLLFVLSMPAFVAVNHWRMSAEQKSIDYWIDKDRVIIRDGTGHALLTPWHAIQSIEEHGAGLVLKQKRGGRWLVKRAFAPADLATLKAMK